MQLLYAKYAENMLLNLSQFINIVFHFHIITPLTTSCNSAPAVRISHIIIENISLRFKKRLTVIFLSDR